MQAASFQHDFSPDLQSHLKGVFLHPNCFLASPDQFLSGKKDQN